MFPRRTVPSCRTTVRWYPPGPCNETVRVGLQGVSPRFPTPTTSSAARVPGSAVSLTPPRVRCSVLLRDVDANEFGRADEPVVVAFAETGPPSSNHTDATSEVRSPILGMGRMSGCSLPVTVDLRTVEVWERFAVLGNLGEIPGDTSPLHEGLSGVTSVFLLRISADSRRHLSRAGRHVSRAIRRAPAPYSACRNSSVEQPRRLPRP